MAGTCLPSLEFLITIWHFISRVFYLEGFTVFCCLELFWEGTKRSFHLGKEMELHLEGVRKSQSCKKTSESFPARKERWIENGMPCSLRAQEHTPLGKWARQPAPSPHCWRGSLACHLCPKFCIFWPRSFMYLPFQNRGTKAHLTESFYWKKRPVSLEGAAQNGGSNDKTGDKGGVEWASSDLAYRFIQVSITLSKGWI